MLVRPDVHPRRRVQAAQDDDPAQDDGQERPFEDGVDEAFAGLVLAPFRPLFGHTRFAGKGPSTDALADRAPVVERGDGRGFGGVEGLFEGVDVGLLDEFDVEVGDQRGVVAVLFVGQGAVGGFCDVGHASRWVGCWWCFWLFQTVLDLESRNFGGFTPRMLGSLLVNVRPLLVTRAEGAFPSEARALAW